VYRANLTTIEQRHLFEQQARYADPDIRGEKSLGSNVSEAMRLVAETAESHVIADLGHFVPPTCLTKIHPR
jgi:hypothetical protein